MPPPPPHLQVLRKVPAYYLPILYQNISIFSKIWPKKSLPTLPLQNVLVVKKFFAHEPWNLLHVQVSFGHSLIMKSQWDRCGTRPISKFSIIPTPDTVEMLNNNPNVNTNLTKCYPMIRCGRECGLPYKSIKGGYFLDYLVWQGVG